MTKKTMKSTGEPKAQMKQKKQKTQKKALSTQKIASSAGNAKKFNEQTEFFSTKTLDRIDFGLHLILLFANKFGLLRLTAKAFLDWLKGVLRSEEEYRDVLSRALSKDPKATKLLLTEGKVDINLQGKDGMAALHHAADDDDLRMVRFLLRHGAEVDIEEINGRTPLHFSASRIYGEDVARALLKGGAKVDSPDLNYNSPLHYAAKYNHLETAKLLLDSGAEIDRQNKIGETPLHLAAIEGSSGVAELLLSKGTNPTLRTFPIPGDDGNGRTAGWCAHSFNHDELSEKLKAAEQEWKNNHPENKPG